MTQDEITNQNLDLLSDFMSYAFEHPDILNQIPTDTTLVILPKKNPSLYKANLEIAKRLQKQDESVVIVEWNSAHPLSPCLKVIPSAK